MNNYLDIIYEISFFVAVVIIFYIMLAIYLKISLKNLKFNKNKTSFYAVFLGMDNKSIFSFSLVSVAYLFLVSMMTNFASINKYYFIIILMMLVLSNVLVKNYNKIVYSIFFTGISSVSLVITHLLYNYLVAERGSIFLIILLGLLLIFMFMFYTYNLLKMLNDVIIVNKNINKQRYKKL